jgi:cell division septum initiation protein DivIVA
MGIRKMKMQMTRIMKSATLSLFATTIGFSLVSKASADEAIMEQTTTTSAGDNLAPGTSATTTTTTGVGKYNVPISTTTTRKTIMDPAPTQQVIQKNTVYTRLSPADASQTIVETQSSDSIKYGKQNYPQRLQNFRSQLDKAIASNWVSAAQAADLNSQYDSLVAQEASVRSHNYPKAETNDFDSHLNAFNIQLSDAMAKGSK